MNFLEKDLETIIYESDKQKLKGRGLQLEGRLLRQLRIGRYGISDLIEVNHDWFDNRRILNINVIEIKKEDINIDTLMQAIGYAKGIHKYLTDIRDFYRFTIDITLIGKSIDKRSNYLYLTDLICPHQPTLGGINSISYFTYSYQLEGLTFNRECGYQLTNDGFSKVNVPKPNF